MYYNPKVIFIAFVVISWIFILYYNYEEVLLSACSLPDHPQLIHSSSQLPLGSRNKLIHAPNATDIGFVFIILVHNLKTIKTALTSIEVLQSQRNYFVVHVDRKVSAADTKVLTDTVAERSFLHVEVISTQSIIWGGKELLPAALDGITVALDKWPDWHYMFLISGDCLPIKSLDYIKTKMTTYWPKNSLSIYRENIEEISQTGPIKQGRFKLKEGQTFNDVVKGLETVYYGTTWVTLTRPFVVWSMENTLARNFLLYLTAAHLDYDPVTGFPSIFEESYYQTIIMHSPFKDTVAKSDECIRFEKWGGCNYKHEDRDVPCALGELDMEQMDGTDCIFARKFVYKNLPTFVTNQLKMYEKPKE